MVEGEGARQGGTARIWQFFAKSDDVRVKKEWGNRVAGEAAEMTRVRRISGVRREVRGVRPVVGIVEWARALRDFASW
jgi:hypothetical protein